MIYVPSKTKRHKHKLSMATGLNLVSLMDIFTILLLFLLIHVSGEAEVIEIPEIVKLPISTSAVSPKPATTVYITTESIFVEERKIAEISDVLTGDGTSIEVLEKELSGRAENGEDTKQPGGRVIIMGDEAIPFTLLKKVMSSCSRAGYPDITLAVIQK